jgi:kinesin family protein 1
MRRSETDFVVEETHDVIAWLQVGELAADGSYRPVSVLSYGPLDPGSFTIHQGLQRRLFLSLISNSGRQLPWTRICRVRLGNVRLLDEKGRVHEATSKDLIDLKILKDQTVEFKQDGTGALSAEILWDSGVHDTILLNRVTSPNQRVLLQLTWFVDVDTCRDPAQFSMDIALTIQARDAGSPSKFMALFISSKILSKTSSVFNLRLTPPLTRSPKDLWRLDTSEKYVRGEETLGKWKPRGLSVVEDYVRLQMSERRSADVQAIKAILAAAPPAPLPPGLKDPDEILRKALTLWQKRFGHPGEIILSQDPLEVDDTSITIPAAQTPILSTGLDDSLKLVASTKLMPRSDNSLKKGHLMLLTDANTNQWQKRWFVLRRPYLHLYAHSNEVEEVQVISLTGVKIEQNPDMEALFGRRFTFTLFTSSNSYALAAPSAKELQAWIAKLDPTRIPS